MKFSLNGPDVGPEALVGAHRQDVTSPVAQDIAAVPRCEWLKPLVEPTLKKCVSLAEGMHSNGSIATAHWKHLSESSESPADIPTDLSAGTRESLLMTVLA